MNRKPLQIHLKEANSSPNKGHINLYKLLPKHSNSPAKNTLKKGLGADYSSLFNTPVRENSTVNESFFLEASGTLITYCENITIQMRLYLF